MSMGILLSSVLLGGVLLGWGTILVLVWSWCVVAGRADNAMDRYFREQRAKARQHGCATPSASPLPSPTLRIVRSDRTARHLALSECPAPTIRTERSQS